MNSSLIEKFWTDFCNNHGISKSSHYEAYSFGDPESAIVCEVFELIK